MVELLQLVFLYYLSSSLIVHEIESFFSSVIPIDRPK